MAKKDSNKYIKSVSAFNGGGSYIPNNVPTQYNDRETRYMEDRASKFDAYRAYLSTDYVNAEAQGIVENDFYKWVSTKIRLADMPNQSSTKRTDDYKQVLFSELGIEYFPVGAKIKAVGNTWICVNPSNISSAKATAIVARCNASYNSYDYYGNVITEPILVEKYSMLGNDNEQKSSIVLMDGYFNVTCQLNKNTAKLQENSRIILGKKPYHITGLTDFIQEFTGDRESCHLLNFTIRVEEPTESDDITEKFIANGNEYEFDCILQGVDNISVGESVEFTPHFVKGNEMVEGTNEYPITWEWESADNEIATVDENGMVTAVSSGSTKITATMVQNPSITTTAELAVVKSQMGENRVVFTSVVPNELTQYDSVVITATYKENGLAIDKPLEWSFSGADDEDYLATVSQDGMSVEITCISPSDKNLTVTASYNGVLATTQIALLGY